MFLCSVYFYMYMFISVEEVVLQISGFEYIYIIWLLYDNLLLLVMPVLSHQMHSIMK